MKYASALCWAAAMIVLALLGRLGIADRDAVLTMMLVMPILAVVTMRGGSRCAIARH